MRSNPDDFSQGPGAKSTSPDDNLNKWSSSTGIMRIINGVKDRILPGDTSQVRQKDRPSAHKQGPVSSAHKQGPVPSPPKQGPVPRPHEQESAPRSHEQVKQESNRLREITLHAQNLENTVRMLREDLNKANTKVAALGKAVTENEAIITQAHATAVSTLAGNVSRGVTDDMIREELKKFFQNDFFSWCADLCTERIVDEHAAIHTLLEVGIINNSESYLNGPGYLKITMNTPDGSSPLVLLQAALAKRLCCLYLNDAYFLAEEPHMKFGSRSRLRQVEQHFCQGKYQLVPTVDKLLLLTRMVYSTARCCHRLEDSDCGMPGKNSTHHGGLYSERGTRLCARILVFAFS